MTAVMISKYLNQSTESTEFSLKLGCSTKSTLFDSMLYVLVNSYGQVGRVCSPNYSFFLGKIDYKTVLSALT